MQHCATNQHSAFRFSLPAAEITTPCSPHPAPKAALQRQPASDGTTRRDRHKLRERQRQLHWESRSPLKRKQLPTAGTPLTTRLSEGFFPPHLLHTPGAPAAAPRTDPGRHRLRRPRSRTAPGRLSPTGCSSSRSAAYEAGRDGAPTDATDAERLRARSRPSRPLTCPRSRAAPLQRAAVCSTRTNSPARALSERAAPQPPALHWPRGIGAPRPPPVNNRPRARSYWFAAAAPLAAAVGREVRRRPVRCGGCKEKPSFLRRAFVRVVKTTSTPGLRTGCGVKTRGGWLFNLAKWSW